jgi:hypothetical protein
MLHPPSQFSMKYQQCFVICVMYHLGGNCSIPAYEVCCAYVWSIQSKLERIRQKAATYSQWFFTFHLVQIIYQHFTILTNAPHCNLSQTFLF